MLPDGSDPQYQFNVAPLQAANIPQIKPRNGMFGGGALQGIAGAIGDYFLQRAGAQPIYSPMMMKRQDRQYEEDQYQRHLKDTMATWLAEQQWKQANPDPNGGSEFERVAVAGGYKPGSQAYIDLMRRKADALANPIVMTTYGPMPYSAVAGQPQAPAKPLTDEDILRMGGQSGVGPTGGFPY
jgi:hypothetical protein